MSERAQEFLESVSIVRKFSQWQLEKAEQALADAEARVERERVEPLREALRADVALFKRLTLEVLKMNRLLDDLLADDPRVQQMERINHVDIDGYMRQDEARALLAKEGEDEWTQRGSHERQGEG